MKIHFVAINELLIQNLAIALYQKGYQVSGSAITFEGSSELTLKEKGFLDTTGWFESNITPNLDIVVFGSSVDEKNPEIIKAKSLNLDVFSYAEFLYELNKEKTRVVVTGDDNPNIIASMIIHVLDYHSKSIDYFTRDKSHLTTDNDFVILSTNLDDHANFHFYRPNITLITEVANGVFEHYDKFITSVTNGGIVVYNEVDKTLKAIVEQTNHVVQKYPYNIPDYFIDAQMVYLQTKEGDLPLDINQNQGLQHILGVKWICQHMGIDQDDFYEAIVSFSLND